MGKQPRRSAAASKQLAVAPPPMPPPPPSRRSFLVLLIAIAAASVSLYCFSSAPLAYSSTTQDGTCADNNNASSAPSPRQIVIASHGRLLLYDLDTQEEEPLLAPDSGSSSDIIPKGAVFYSVFPSRTPERTVYCALRGDLDRGDLDFVVEIDLVERRVVGKFQLPSTSFTHEVVRHGDLVLCADTGSGAVNVLQLPIGGGGGDDKFTLLHRFAGKFSAAHHVNTLAPVDSSLVWATFLNSQGGEGSFAALLDWRAGEVVRTVRDIGQHVHSWVEWPGPESSSNLRVYLSSKEAKLCVYDLDKNTRRVIYTSPAHQSKQKAMFLKGLLVVDDVAYFGESEMRDRKGRETVQSALVAVHLVTKRVVFRRAFPGSVGLINTLSVLGVESATYRAQEGKRVWKSRTPPPPLCPAVPALLDTYRFARRTGYAFGRFPEGVAVAQLPYRADNEDSASLLQRDVDALVRRHEWTLRPDVNNYFVLLLTQHGVATDQSNVGPFRPVDARLDADGVAPHIRRLLVQLGCVVGRTRLMMIRPGEEVKAHFDRTDHVSRHTGQPDVSSGYWGRRFRIHVPIQTHANVTFSVGSKSEVHMRAGEVFIFDNSKMHKVSNRSNQTRVHLVIDTVGGPRFFRALESAITYPRSSSKEEGVDLPALPLPHKHGSQFLFEDWADAPVHVPMTSAALNKYFTSQVLSQLEPGSAARDKAHKLFSSFIKRWTFAPAAPTAVSLDIWDVLLAPAICSGVELKNGYTLYEALEPIARMALYRCVADERELGALCAAKHDE